MMEALDLKLHMGVSHKHVATESKSSATATSALTC